MLVAVREFSIPLELRLYRFELFFSNDTGYWHLNPLLFWLGDLLIYSLPRAQVRLIVFVITFHLVIVPATNVEPASEYSV